MRRGRHPDELSIVDFAACQIDVQGTLVRDLLITELMVDPVNGDTDCDGLNWQHDSADD